MRPGRFIGIGVFILTMSLAFQAVTQQDQKYLLKIHAPDSFTRTMVEESGASIVQIKGDTVYAIGGYDERRIFERRGWLKDTKNIEALDYPRADEAFHNYSELTTAIGKLVGENPGLVTASSIGKTHEFRDIWEITITDHSVSDQDKSSIVFMGGHHAREHLSVEMPLMLAQHLAEKFNQGDSEIRQLLKTRTIHIIPLVNPDGAEYDIASGRYQYWRKNRRNNSGGSYGVDLNRNYGFKWGTGGSSRRQTADTYMGPRPFSEPESQAIRDYVRGLKNLGILVSFHTFSELILYPWGHKNGDIENRRDLQTHKKIAQTMARWNGYRPMQSSDLYVASGDTTDWSYGELGVISFTFELDPANQSQGGFYPGAGKIPVVFDKNIQPCMYLIGLADNPHKVLD